jgi:S-formylglutathione hydrolase FrmB
LRLASVADPLPERFLLAAGENDWARAATEDFVAELSARGAVPELIIVPGDHSDPTWQAMLPSVIDFLASALGPL